MWELSSCPPCPLSLPHYSCAPTASLLRDPTRGRHTTARVDSFPSASQRPTAAGVSFAFSQSAGLLGALASGCVWGRSALLSLIVLGFVAYLRPMAEAQASESNHTSTSKASAHVMAETVRLTEANHLAEPKSEVT